MFETLQTDCVSWTQCEDWVSSSHMISNQIVCGLILALFSRNMDLAVDAIGLQSMLLKPSDLVSPSLSLTQKKTCAKQDIHIHIYNKHVEFSANSLFCRFYFLGGENKADIIMSRGWSLFAERWSSYLGDGGAWSGFGGPEANTTGCPKKKRRYVTKKNYGKIPEYLEKRMETEAQIKRESIVETANCKHDDTHRYVHIYIYMYGWNSWSIMPKKVE